MRCRASFVAAVVLVTGGLRAPLARAADVTAEKGKDAIEFKVGKEVVARYQFAGTVQLEKGEGTKPLAKPFLWPVLSPAGVHVTRDWPMDRSYPQKADHFHQKSVWFCHGDVIPEGIDLKGKHAVDFWSEAPGHGRIVCVKVGDPKAEKGGVSVTTWNEWQTADGVKVMDEERTITFRDLPGGRLFVFDCKLTASTCPVTFGDTKEGSFGVRVHDAMRVEQASGGVVTSSDGTTAKAPMKENLPMWGKPADWHDYSGTVGGKEAGVAVFDDPANKYRSAWHTRAYGLVAANPFGRDKSGFPSQKGKADLVKLDKGGELRLRYGVYAHDGDAKSGKVAEAFEAFRK